MSQQSVTKNFVFNEKIDNAFIFSLYENDYECIADVFNTSLESFDSDLDEVEKAFKTDDLDRLRKAVHKMKPVFGFVGLLQHQEKIGSFEKTCSMVANTAALTPAYDNLLQVFYEGKYIMMDELKRLKAILD